jgi:hypothetical protein
MLFWRGLFAGLFLGAMVAVQERGRFVQAFRNIGVTGLLVALSRSVGR